MAAGVTPTSSGATSSEGYAATGRAMSVSLATLQRMKNGGVSAAAGKRAYGVKLVRGPFLVLPEHELACRTDDDLVELSVALRCERPEVRLAADLFSGAGGLSLGLEAAGFQVILAVDHDKEAADTHRHHFPGLTVDWDLSQADNIERVAALLTATGVELLAGGPPCQPFSRAGRSKVRHQIHHGLRDPHDRRRDLWRGFLEVVRLAMPHAVIMENVPDMALDKDMFILRAMVEELENLGYAVEEKVIDASRFGVPQFRQRLILIALRGGVRFDWPAEATERVTVWNAIGDLPEVEGGWRPEGGADGWTDYSGPITGFQRRLRAGEAPEEVGKLFDHITRPVRADDAIAFDLMDSTTKYSDLPEHVKRYREDIFDDKYKRLAEDDLSRTITAHIAKDGYWYIHPRQGRTLTVREAARLQTFPDRYRFSGPPSAAFRQIGNAVPPFLAEHLGWAVAEAMNRNEQARYETRKVAATLSEWFRARDRLNVPWLRARTRWQVVTADLLLDRADPANVRMVWPLLQRWDTPDLLLAEDEALTQLGTMIGRGRKVTVILELADWLIERPGALDEPELDHTAIPNLPESVTDLAMLIVPVAGPEDSDEPVLITKGVLRVASRVTGEPVDRRNRLTDGRLAVARMIGGGLTARNAHLGLIELAATICRPVAPLCSECPLANVCALAIGSEPPDTTLF